MSPTPTYVIVLGYAAGGVTRGILVSIIVTSVALFFTKLDIHSWLVVIGVVSLTSISFSLLGLINAVFANTFDDVNIVPTFVLTPLTYLGGVFYSLDLLPTFWASLSQINPLVYVVNAFRYGVLGVSDVDITVSFTMLTVLTVASFAYAMHLLGKGTRLRT